MDRNIKNKLKNLVYTCEYVAKMDRIEMIKLIFGRKNNENYLLNEKESIFLRNEKVINTINYIYENNYTLSDLYEFYFFREKKEHIKLFSQFFTPLWLVNLIYKKIDFTNINNVVNLTCGCGNLFLPLLNKNLDINIFGYDIDEELIELTKINLINYPQNKITIECKNTLYENIDYLKQIKNKLFILNPPFTLKNLYNKENIYTFNKGILLSELIYLNNCLELMNKNDKLIIILPLSFIQKNNNYQYQYLRRRIINDFQLELIFIIKNIKFINTNINLCILFIENNKNNEQEIIRTKIYENEKLINVKYITKSDFITKNQNEWKDVDCEEEYYFNLPL